MLAVIITTLNEQKNIGRLIPAIHESLKTDYCIVVVDDNSQDRTQGIVIGLSKRFPVKLLARPKKMGIASAIMDGIKFQPADAYITMEADWSHPPTMLPTLRRFLDRYDLVVGSRYADCGTGRTEGWPLKRKIISIGANILSRPLTPIKDRTTGFMAIRAECLKGVELNPVGMHFPLECFVKANYESYIELPYTFVHRTEGDSSFNFKECWLYLKHLWRLYQFKRQHTLNESVVKRLVTYYIVGMVVIILILIFVN